MLTTSRRARRALLGLPAAAVVAAALFGAPAAMATTVPTPGPVSAPTTTVPAPTTQGIIMRDGGVCDPIRHMGC